MIFERHTGSLRRWFHLFAIVVFFLFATLAEIKAQEDPPRPPSITLTTDLSFGAFSHGATGGTVTVDEFGIRSATGSVVLLLLGYPVSAAHFNVYANAGAVINILNITDFLLTWSGYSMNVHIETTNPASPFVNTNPYSIPTELTIGATLSVGSSSANPPGSYTGTFDVTIVLE